MLSPLQDSEVLLTSEDFKYFRHFFALHQVEMMRQNQLLPLLSLLTFLLLLAPLVIAQTEILVAPVDNEITVKEEAVFDVTITNPHGEERTYTLYNLDVIWSLMPEQAQFILPALGSKTMKVRVKPLGPFQPSKYVVKLYVDSSLSTAPAIVPAERTSIDLPIILFPEEPVEYAPAVKLVVDMDEKVSPEKPFSIKVSLQNKNPRDLSGLRLYIQSELPEFAKEALLDLTPLGDKIVELTVTPNPLQPPKKYALFFTVDHQGQTVKVVQEEVEILPYQPEFTVEKTEQSIFLKKKVALMVRNPGNVPQTQAVRMPISFLDALVTSGLEIVKESGQRYLTTEVTLEPGETMTVSAVTNYRLPLYALMIVLLLTALYYLLKSPVQLQKRATAHQGELSEIKVTLDVKNISGKHVKEVRITDLVPSIANLEKGLQLGTITPHDIKHTAQGTKVHWLIPELEPKEHRLITYSLRAKFNIVGTLSLPRATAEFKKGKRPVKTYSNLARVS